MTAVSHEEDIKLKKKKTQKKTRCKTSKRETIQDRQKQEKPGIVP